MTSIVILGAILMLSISMMEGISLKCKLGTHYFSDYRDCYTCDAKITNSTNPEKIEKIHGLHQRGKTNSDVECFYIHNKPDFTSLYGLSMFFKNLKRIYLSCTGIDEITDADLKGLDKIEKDNIIIKNEKCPNSMN